MRKLLTGLFTFIAVIAQGQANIGNFLGSSRAIQPTQKELDEQARARALYIANWLPEHPWRIIDGKTNWARGKGWVQFSGRVMEANSNGVWISGIYGPPPYEHYKEGESAVKEIVIHDLPYRVAENDVIGIFVNLTALDDGFDAFISSSGNQSVFHKLTYGTPCDAPPPPPELVAAQIAAQTAKSNAIVKAKQDADARTLKWNQEQAEQGDPYGLLRMGQRYATGEGVEKDISKSRTYLSRAASLGNEIAQEELNKLDAPSPPKTP